MSEILRVPRLERRHAQQGRESMCPPEPGTKSPGIYKERFDGPSEVLFDMERLMQRQPTHYTVAHSIYATDYVLERELGMGEFGQVLLVVDVRDPTRRYALKVSKTFYTKRHNADIRREAMIMAQIASAGIREGIEDKLLMCHKAWEESNKLFILMDLLDSSVPDVMLLEDVIPDDVVKTFCLDVLQSLAFVHDQGLVHLDVKLDNIFIRSGVTQSMTASSVERSMTPVDSDFRSGFGGSTTLFDLSKVHFVLGDFGLARTPNASYEAEEGDCRYLSRELMKGEPPDTSCDIFAFGLSLLELCADIVLPMRGNMWDWLRSCPSPEALRSCCEVPRPMIFFNVISMCLQEPKKRPSAAVLINYLNNGGAGSSLLRSSVFERFTPKNVVSSALRSSISQSMSKSSTHFAYSQEPLSSPAMFASPKPMAAQYNPNNSTPPRYRLNLSSVSPEPSSEQLSFTTPRTGEVKSGQHSAVNSPIFCEPLTFRDLDSPRTEKDQNPLQTPEDSLTEPEESHNTVMEETHQTIDFKQTLWMIALVLPKFLLYLTPLLGHITFALTVLLLTYVDNIAVAMGLAIIRSRAEATGDISVQQRIREYNRFSWQVILVFLTAFHLLKTFFTLPLPVQPYIPLAFLLGFIEAGRLLRLLWPRK